MTDTKTLIMSTGAQVTPKKAQKTKKPRTKPTHPRTSDMVNSAIKSLKERNGSSLQAIKKYITSTYKVDAEKHAPFIKRYLKTAVTGGNLVQTKGKGAAGSFKLSLGDSSKAKKRPALKSSLKKTPVKKTVKKTVKKPVKKAPKSPEKKKIIKGPAAKPPKVKTAAKVKAPPKSKRTPKKVVKVVKKKPVKKTVAKKK